MEAKLRKTSIKCFTNMWNITIKIILWKQQVFEAVSEVQREILAAKKLRLGRLNLWEKGANHDLKQFLHKKLSSVEGLNAIGVSSKDVVPIINSKLESMFWDMPSYLLLLQQIKWEQIWTFKNWKHHPLLYNLPDGSSQCFPLVMSFIASSNANTGLTVNLEKEFVPYFKNW
jgi:mitogen-activated protein kinase kinase 1 interacting protein 1